ncbi:MAG: hypothetical protein ACKOFZ_05990 [Ilumatobacteraceae bacterium]
MTSDLQQDIANALASALGEVAAASDTRSLQAVVTAVHGKKGQLAVLKSQLGQLDDLEQRKEMGRLIGEAQARLQASISERETVLKGREHHERVA